MVKNILIINKFFPYYVRVKKQNAEGKKSDHLQLFSKSNIQKRKKTATGKKSWCERHYMCPEKVFLVKQVKMTAQISGKAPFVCTELSMSV